MTARPLKFRAWDKKKKRMHYGGFSVHAGGKIEPLKGLGPVDPTVMQFTGLLDKNGEEIWEGDIVIGDVCPRVIKLIEGDFFFGLPPAKELEIIGNVHQNSELLNQAKGSPIGGL